MELPNCVRIRTPSESNGQVAVRIRQIAAPNIGPEVMFPSLGATTELRSLPFSENNTGWNQNMEEDVFAIQEPLDFAVGSADPGLIINQNLISGSQDPWVDISTIAMNTFDLPLSTQSELFGDPWPGAHLSPGFGACLERTRLSTITLLRCLDSNILSLSRRISQELRPPIDLGSLCLQKFYAPGTEIILLKHSADFRVFYMVLYALINNHVSLERLTKPGDAMDEVITNVLQQFNDLSPDRFAQFLDSFPRYFRTGITRNLFCAAIELGANRIVREILKRGFDPSQVTISVGCEQSTPLERSCILGHAENTSSLLAHGPASRKRLGRSLYGSCLLDDRNHSALPPSRLTIFRLLLQAGIEFCREDILYINVCQDPRLYLTLAKHPPNAPTGSSFWSDVLIHLCKTGEESIISSTLRLVLDKNRSPEVRRSTIFQARLSACLAEAALRNYQQVFQILVAEGAKPNLECLGGAIEGKNISAIAYCLDYGVSCFEEFLDGDTPIAVAIRTKSAEIREIFWCRNQFQNLVQHPNVIAAAVSAACAVGDETMLDYILHLCESHVSRLVDFQGTMKNAEGAIRNGHGTLVKRALQAGFSLKGRSFSQALESGELELARLVMETTLELQPTIDDLAYVARFGDLKLFEDLVLAGASLDGFLVAVDYPFEKDCKHPILTTAILSGNNEITDFLLNLGAPLDYRKCDFGDRKWLSPLFAATRKQNYNLIQELLARGASPFDDFAILEASSNCDYRAACMILTATENGPRRHKMGFIADSLAGAVTREDVDMLRLLLKYADPNDLTHSIRSNLLRRPLMVSPFGTAIASESVKSLDMMTLFLDSGANVHSIVERLGDPQSHSKTALLQAIASKQISKVKILVDAGAKIDVTPILGVRRTPLQAAVEIGALDIVQYLLQKGANANEPPMSRQGATSLQLAARAGYVGIASLLIEYGADVNAAPALMLGYWAFEAAASQGRIEMMVFLMDMGADLISNGSEQYKCAVESAKAYGHPAAVELAERLYAEACGRTEPRISQFLEGGVRI